MAKIMNDDTKPASVDINIYLACTKSLIKKYGNVKMSQELHNTIIANLCEICTYIECQKERTHDSD